MPWHIGAKGSSGCTGYPVVLNATGKVVGCHPTKAKALAQLAALNINAKEATRMAGKREYRQVIAEYRVDAGKPGEIVADVLTYNKLDDYGTSFRPGCFTESLNTRMPRICWAHDWTDPIGTWTDAEDTKQRMRLKGQLDLQMIDGTTTPAVPSAHRAAVQLRSKTIDQFSVGFVRQVDEKGKVPGTYDILKGILDEASPVLVGAVPGTRLVSVRSRANASRVVRSGVPAGTSLWVPADVMQGILMRYETGEIDLAQALADMKSSSLTYDELPKSEDPDDDDPEELDPPEDPDDPEDPEDGWTDEDLDKQLAELGLEIDA